MRILHTSDWHLGKSLEQINRIEEQRDFINCLCKIAEEQKVDLVLIAGDIYDTYNPSAAAEELFYNTIDRLNDRGRRAVVVIAGNHDNPERLCAASSLAYNNGIILLGYPGSNAGMYRNRAGSYAGTSETGAAKIQIIDAGPGWLELNIPECGHHAMIITLPYPSEARLEEILAEQADENMLQKGYSDKIAGIFSSLSVKFRDDTVNLGVGHLFLNGGSTSESERTIQVGGAMTVDPGALPSNAHFIALGHLHRPQEIRNSPCPAFYSGSPLAYSFSEAHYSKAVYIIDAMPGEKANIQPVYLDCGKPLRKWVAEEGFAQAYKWCEDARDQNAWVDLEIVTDRVLTIEEQKQLRVMHPGIINIRPRLKTDALEALSPESREGRKIDELFSDYYKYRMGVEISEELMGAFVEILNEQEEMKDSSAGREENYAVKDPDNTEYSYASREENEITKTRDEDPERYT